MGVGGCGGEVLHYSRFASYNCKVALEPCMTRNHNLKGSSSETIARSPPANVKLKKIQIPIATS